MLWVSKIDSFRHFIFWVDGCIINHAYLESFTKLGENLIRAAGAHLTNFPGFYYIRHKSFKDVAALTDKFAQNFFEEISIQTCPEYGKAPSSEESPTTVPEEVTQEDFSLIELAPIFEEHRSQLVDSKKSDPKVQILESVVSFLKDIYRPSLNLVAEPFTDIIPALSECKFHIL